MKKLITLVFALFSAAAVMASSWRPAPVDSVLFVQSANPNVRNKVRIVDSGADMNVRIVNSNADTHVFPIQGDPSFNALLTKAGVRRNLNTDDIRLRAGYGVWEFVEQGEDFTVQFVDKKEDLAVKFIFDTIALARAQRVVKHISDSILAVQNAAWAARMAEEEAAERAARSSYSSSSSSNRIVDCKCKGIPLHGCVKVVEYAPADFEVQVVTYAPADLHVQVVNSAPSRCGEWQFVEYGEDFTVLFVSAAADFTIQYVGSVPGVY